jgi:proton glutamate symport protein
MEGYGALGVALVFDVQELLNLGRTCINVVGNCLATCVVARWEGEIDDERARVFGTRQEAA